MFLFVYWMTKEDSAYGDDSEKKKKKEIKCGLVRLRNDAERMLLP